MDFPRPSSLADRRLLAAACLVAAAALRADDLPGFLVLDPTPSRLVTQVGTVTAASYTVTNASSAYTTFGVTGANIGLGIISDSFNGSGTTPTLSTQIAAGNLPGSGNPFGRTTGVTVLKDDAGTDEGRAMLEIVHDIAPGARLYFHSAFNNTAVYDVTSHLTATPDQTIADAINALAGVSGMRLIADDVGILTAARFQDGAAARAANAAAAKGIGYFSAAGNSATNATRVTTSVGPGGVVNWGTDTLLACSVAAQATAQISLHWGESYTSLTGAATTSDLALEVTSANGSVTYLVADSQGPGDDPYEFISFTNTGATAIPFALRVTRLTGSAPIVVQASVYGLTITDVDNTRSPTVFGQAAATGAVGVAAVPAGNPSAIETFSSRGNTLILFDEAGNPVNQTRQTPLLAAPDGVATTTSGFTAFYGTSAAAPAAVAVAALVLERLDAKGITVTTPQLYRILYDSAVDISTAGVDANSGYGRIDALAACSAGTTWDGNGATAGAAGNGKWSDAKWTLEADGTKPTGKFIRSQVANFGQAGGAATVTTVTVDADYEVAGLRFLSGTTTLAAGGGTLTLAAPTVEVASGLTATANGVLAGSAGLTKSGNGTLVLAGANTYSGATTVDAGKLVINGSIAGALSVAAGATLGGSGTIAGPATVAGIHGPGNSPGIGTFLGDLTYQSGAVVQWELGASTDLNAPAVAFDQIVVGGNLTFAGATTLALSFAPTSIQGTVDWLDAFWNQDRQWVVFDVAGATAGFARLSLAAGPWLDADGTSLAAIRQWAHFEIALSGSDVVLSYSAIPEPGTYGFALGALALAASAIRRRKRTK